MNPDELASLARGVVYSAIALAVICAWLFGYIPWLGRLRFRERLAYQAVQAKVADIFPAPVRGHSELNLMNLEFGEQLLLQNRLLVQALQQQPVFAAVPHVAPAPPPPPTPAAPPPVAAAPPPVPSAPPPVAAAPPPPPVAAANPLGTGHCFPEPTAPTRLRVQPTLAPPDAWHTFTGTNARTPVLDFTLLKEPTATPKVPEPTGPPRFDQGEPEVLAEFESQQVIVQYLQASIHALDATECACNPIALTGPAGTGKTALMKAFANSLRQRNLERGCGETDYLELFPADVATRADLERVLRRAAVRPAVLRIDELHTIDREHAVLLYELLANRAYRFDGDTHLTPFHKLTVIAATTDWALLHEALRRRFEHMAFEPLTPGEISAAVARQPFQIDAAALTELVSRTQFSGVLWEALRLHKQATTFARAAGAEHISMLHLQQVFELNGLDALGLTAMDRRVLRVMLGMPRKRRIRDLDEVVAYGGAEAQVAQVAQLDLGSYRAIVKPKLLSRGLVTMRSPYGQVLTDRAVTLYAPLLAP